MYRKHVPRSYCSSIINKSWFRVGRVYLYYWYVLLDCVQSIIIY